MDFGGWDPQTWMEGIVEGKSQAQEFDINIYLGHQRRKRYQINAFSTLLYFPFLSSLSFSYVPTIVQLTGH